MSMRNKSESLDFPATPEWHVSLAQTSAVTVASDLWLVGENELSLDMCRDAPCISSLWLLKQSQGWTSSSDKANTSLKQHFEPECFGISWQTRAFPGITNVLCICFSLLKESRTGLCSLAALQNGLSWVLLLFHLFHLPSDLSDLIESLSH